MKLNTHEISQRSIALVQRRLALAGISPLQASKNRRVHFVWKSPTGRVTGFQVKGNLEAKPGGGKGKLALDWWIDEDAPADVFALVDLSTERVWLMTLQEVEDLAQQRSSGRHHLYMYIDPSAVLRRGNYDSDFHGHLLESKVPGLVG